MHILSLATYPPYYGGNISEAAAPLLRCRSCRQDEEERRAVSEPTYNPSRKITGTVQMSMGGVLLARNLEKEAQKNICSSNTAGRSRNKVADGNQGQAGTVAVRN